MDLNLRGKTVMITGASKGIGAATAEAFAEEGADVWLAARSTEQLEAVCADLSARFGVKATPCPADIRNPQDLARLAGIAEGLDILVNNAGDIPAGPIGVVDEETWRHAWELKVFGYINLIRPVFAAMKTRGAGVIVNVIGAAGESFPAGYIAGAAGNASLMAFTRALGSNSLHSGVRVVAINPGPVETDRMITQARQRARDAHGDPERWRDMLKGMPLDRAAKPREIGDMAAFLASDRSGYTTGTVITINGGGAPA